MDYLMPAGSKKQMLIFGIFKPFDLILFGSGAAISILLLMILSPASFLFAMIDIAPVLITGFLVLPIPNYHNTLNALVNVYKFYTSRQRYIWKGWCVKDAFKQK